MFADIWQSVNTTCYKDFPKESPQNDLQVALNKTILITAGNMKVH